MSTVWTRLLDWLRAPFAGGSLGGGHWVEPSNELIRAILGGPILLPRLTVVALPSFEAFEVALPPVEEQAASIPAHVFEDDLYEEPAAAPIPFPGRAA